MNNNDIKDMEFEKALAELEKIVVGLESGTISLKDSVEMYERGIALKNRCEGLLEHARLTVEQISSEHNESENKSDDDKELLL